MTEPNDADWNEEFTCRRCGGGGTELDSNIPCFECNGTGYSK
jgi:DnaJ-class molecular chaperone